LTTDDGVERGDKPAVYCAYKNTTLSNYLITGDGGTRTRVLQHTPITSTCLSFSFNLSLQSRKRRYIINRSL